MGGRMLTPLTDSRVLELGCMAECPTVGEWITAWLSDFALMRVCGSTYRGYEGVVRRYIVPYLGAVPLDELSHDMVQAFYRALQAPGARRTGGPLSARTVLQVHVVLHQALTRAVALRRLELNPADRAQGVERPRIRYKQLERVPRFHTQRRTQRPLS